MQYLLSEIASICNANFIGIDSLCASICYDSRMLYSSDNALFVALNGAKIDGHNYIQQCYNKGIRAFMVSTAFTQFEKYPLAGFVVVDDTLNALQELAMHHRTKSKATVVAITGSSGKSTVKEIASQLYHGEGALFRSPKSYNSQLGVALSLLRTSGKESLIIIEAGISKCGEMAKLAKIIDPEIVVITNIGDAHSENFTDNSQKLEEKLLLATLPNCKKIVYNSSSWESQIIESRFDRTKLSPWNENSFSVTSPFDDNIYKENIFAAIALLSAANYMPNDLDKQIAALQRISMRMELLNGKGNSLIINDSYNSDLGSIKEALSYMQSISNNKQKRIVILSDILQSGLDSELLYSKVAQLLSSASIEYFIGIGPELTKQQSKFKKLKYSMFLSVDECIKKLDTSLISNSLILLKGCRSFALEQLLRVVEHKHHNTILEINIDNLLHNIAFYRSKIEREVKTMVMVKAEAYGCGAVGVSKALERAKVDSLAVAYCDEGVTLRESGITLPIVVLGSDYSSHRSMIEHFLEPEIYSFEVLHNFIAECKAMAVTNYPIHIKIDSGMHRVGFNKHHIDELITILKGQNSVEVKSIFSHLVASDDAHHDEFTEYQIGLFDAMSSQLINNLDNKPIRHICNSAAISRFPHAHYDMVRIGIGAYGYGSDKAQLKGVAQLKSIVTQIRHVAKGESVGYNRRHFTQHHSKIATIAIGYADGLRRSLSCGAWSVMINGKLAPIVGNISMDSAMIDSTDIDINIGDYVTIFGAEPTLEEMAAKLSTIEYEVLTSVSPRVKRSYIKE
ncbi:MAG: alanine racemase [Rikenellaceae bacterium]